MAATISPLVPISDREVAVKTPIRSSRYIETGYIARPLLPGLPYKVCGQEFQRPKIFGVMVISQTKDEVSTSDLRASAAPLSDILGIHAERKVYTLVRRYVDVEQYWII